MFFWKKNKSIVLDCFTSDPFVYEYAKIAPSTQYYPEWWKNIKPEIEVGKSEISGQPIMRPTIKGCRGLTSLYKHSFVIPMWDFVTIETFNTKFEWTSTHNKHSIERHPSIQYDGWVNNSKYSHFKLVSPWWCKTDSEINFMYVDPVWSRSGLTDYNVLPGVMDFKYQNSTNVNIMVEHKDTLKTVKFSVGDPLVHIVPLTDKEVHLRCHLVGERDLDGVIPDTRLNDNGLSYKQYAFKKKFIDNYNERNKKKCPFGFK